MVGSQRESGLTVKESTFPLCYIFNKVQHAWNYFAFNSHISFQNEPFTCAAANLSFCTFLFTHYQKHIRSNAGHMLDSSAVVPFPLSVCGFGREVCMPGIYREVVFDHICYHCLKRAFIVEWKHIVLKEKLMKVLCKERMILNTA